MYYSVSNSTVYIEREIREQLLRAAHGGIGVNLDERISKLLLFVHQAETWDDAQEYCKQKGGNLFSDVDGTTDQLDFLLEKMNRKNHWLGIYTEDHQEWMKVSRRDTIPAEKLIWGKDQPNNIGGSQLYVVNYYSTTPGVGYLGDAGKSEKVNFICDLL